MLTSSEIAEDFHRNDLTAPISVHKPLVSNLRIGESVLSDIIRKHIKDVYGVDTVTVSFSHEKIECFINIELKPRK